MEIGTIKAVHIYVCDQLYLTAELELNVKGVPHKFGGKSIVVTGSNGGSSGDAPYLGRFLFRCMEVCGVDTYYHLKNSKVLTRIVENEVVEIMSLSGQKSFNPAKEFRQMENERSVSDQISNKNIRT